MQIKEVLVFWLLMFFLLSSNLLLAQKDSTPEQLNKEEQTEKGKTHQLQENGRFILTEEQMLSDIDRVLKYGDTFIAMEEMSFVLHLILQNTEIDNSQKLADKIMAIPEYKVWNRERPEYAYRILRHKLVVLRNFEKYIGVREYVIEHLNHELPRVQESAAGVLLSWGDWELAVPIICKYDAYYKFHGIKDERLYPLLEQAIQSGSWHGRMLAAEVLFYTFADSTVHQRIALDIILNAPINTDDFNTNKAKYMALSLVPRYGLTEALPGLIRLSQDTGQGIASKAVGYLIDLSGMGHQEATQALIDIKDNHADANIREMANNGLLKLEEEQK